MPLPVFCLVFAYMVLSGGGLIWFATMRYRRLGALGTIGIPAMARVTSAAPVPRRPDLLNIGYRFQLPTGEEITGRSVAALAQDEGEPYREDSTAEIVYLPGKPSASALKSELPVLVKNADRFRKIIVLSQGLSLPLILGLLWFCVAQGQPH